MQAYHQYGFVDYKKGRTRYAAASDKVYQLLANKTNEVSNYIGNTSVHITMKKQILELLRNKEKNYI